MGLDTVHTFHRPEVPHVHVAVATACHQRIPGQLQLTHQLGMPLQGGQTRAIVR